MPPLDGTLYHALARVPDHRQARGQSYSLPALLTFAATAMLCGAKSLYAIAQWGRDYNHLAPLLGFTRPRPRGRPGHRTPCASELHAVFARLDVARFEAALTAWVRAAGVRIDPAVYDHQRLVRLPNSRHPRTGLYKRLVTADELFRLTADGVLTARDLRENLDGVMTGLRKLALAGAGVVAVSSVSRQRDERGRSAYAGLGLASFRGSAELEFGADSAYLLGAAGGVAVLRCLKNRYGPPADIHLRFSGEFQRYDPGDPLDGFDAAPGAPRKGAGR